MSRRSIIFCLIAVMAAALFVRLGAWQLSRRAERATHNAMVLARQAEPVQAVSAITGDSSTLRFRSASVTGRFDYRREVVLANRTRRGSPGVEILTPVRIADHDTAVLVNRGWVYSPNGTQVDRTRWKEGDTAVVAGYVELYAPPSTAAPSTDPRVIRRVSSAELAARIPYPIAPFYLVSTGDTTARDHPARLDPPPLDAGPHGAYAFQWFAFAAIALGGAGVVLARERRGASPDGSRGRSDAGSALPQ